MLNFICQSGLQSTAAPAYLGKGTKDTSNTWHYTIDLNASPLPNGDYKFYAKITKMMV